jgi:hypothetical protein
MGVDLAQFRVFQTPVDNMFDGVEDLIPGSAKGPRRFLSTKGDAPSRPERARVRQILLCSARIRPTGYPQLICEGL